MRDSMEKRGELRVDMNGGYIEHLITWKLMVFGLMVLSTTNGFGVY